MNKDELELLKTFLYMALAPVEAKHKEIIRSSIKYCVVLDNEGKLVTSDWLNDYPEVLKEIREKYDWALSNIQR